MWAGITNQANVISTILIGVNEAGLKVLVGPVHDFGNNAALRRNAMTIFAAAFTRICVYIQFAVVHTEWKGGHERACKLAHVLSRGVAGERRRNRQCGPPPKWLVKCRLFENLTLSVICNDASFTSAGDRT